MSDEAFFKRLEEIGVLQNTLASLGWAFWPCDKNGKFIGYLDEHTLRKLADEIEKRNAPFWAEYDEATRGMPQFVPSKKD